MIDLGTTSSSSSSSSLRARAAVALATIVDDGRLATRVVPALLRGVALDPERRWLKDVVYGAAVLRLRLRHLHGDDVAGWIDHVFDDQRDDDDDEARSPGVRDGRWPADPVARLGLQRSCPGWLVARLVASLGLDGARRFLAASNRPGPVTLRANTLKNDRGALAMRLREEGVDVVDNAVAPWAVDVVGKANLTALLAWRAGGFEVQDAGSQRIAAATAVVAGDVVVDLCAGRGGKTLALAAMMEDRGTLHVEDVNEAALADLRGRLRRAGVSCVVRGLPADGGADVVLVDAPCSSLGVLRRSPDLRFALRPVDIEAVAVVQRQLLARAAALVKPGGRVVYATCSVLHDENGAVVDDVAGAVGLGEVSRSTLLPHVEGCDGFFISVLEKS